MTLHLLRAILQSRCNFDERELNIMAAIFEFNSSGRLGRERNLYQGAPVGQK